MNRREAEELLPWFAAGTLSEDERRAVQAFIDSGEISQDELREVTDLAASVSEVASEEPAYNARILQDVLKKLDDVPQQEPVEPVVVQEIADERPGLLQRLTDAIAWRETPRFSKLAMAAQFAMVLALAVVIVIPGEESGELSYQTVAGDQANADLVIAFVPGTTEQAMRGLLAEIGGQIVAGPNSLGMYQIDLPDSADAADVVRALQSNAMVGYAQPAAAQ